MKKLCCVALVLLWAGRSYAVFDDVSFRMQGINQDLAGIVSDEYTDTFSVNPADLINVKGYRLYTNFANLSGKNDRAFRDAGPGLGGTGGADFLLGGFGNPFTRRLPRSQMGGFFSQTSSINPGTNTMGGTGESINNLTVNTDSNADGDFGDAGDTILTTNRSAKREAEDGSTDFQLLYAQKIDNSLKIGFQFVPQFYSSEEPILGSYYRNNTTIGTPNTVTFEDSSLSAKETFSNLAFQLGGGVRWKMFDSLDFGGTLNITPIINEQKREASATIRIDNTAGGANPITAEATAVDGNLHTIPGGYGVTAGSPVTAGFGFTGGSFFTGLGLSGNEIGKNSSKGIGFGLSVDSHFYQSKKVKFVGRMAVNSASLSVDGDLSQPYTETLRSRTLAGDKQTVNNDTKWTVGGDDKTTAFALTLGSEVKMPEDVTFAYGLIYANLANQENLDWSRSLSNTTVYDRSNDGFDNSAASGDSRTTVTDNNGGNTLNETKTNTIIIPLGMEAKITKRMVLRLGVSHQIADTKSKSETQITRDDLQLTRTETGGATTEARTAASTTTKATIVPNRHDKDRTTQYYYGAGFAWNENLYFDVLNFSGASDGANSAGLLDLGAWRLGLTLMF
ncbi:MAG: hypothetical protein ABII74_01105 [Elusimicrobiota bacterium]